MGLLDLPERFASWLGDLIRENFKAVLVVGLAVWLAVVWGIIDIPRLEIPLWARVLGTFGAVGGVGGIFLASMRFDGKEPDWNYVHEYNSDDPATPRVTKVTDKVVEEMEVYGGRRLRSPQGKPKDYVCRYFNGSTERPIAHVTWKDVPSDSELLGTRPDRIEEEIVALRDTYEETHGRYQWVLDHLYMVVRRLDYRRSRSQNDVLEDHVAPSMGGDTISEIVDDVIPERLRPDRVRGADQEDSSGAGSKPDYGVDDLEDDVDAIASRTAPETAATDGGESTDE